MATSKKRRTAPPKRATKSTGRKKDTKYLIQVSYDEFSYAQATSGSYAKVGVIFNTRGRKKTVQVDLSRAPILLTKALSQLEDLDSEVLATIRAYLNRDPSEILDQIVDSPDALNRAVNALVGKPDPVLEYQLNGHWYPIPIKCELSVYFFGAECEIRADLCAQDEEIEPRWQITRRHFLDEGGLPLKRSVRAVLEGLGLRPTTPERLQNMRRKLLKVEGLSEKFGVVVDVSKPVLVPTLVGWWKVLVPTYLSGEGTARSVIIENQLEREAGKDADAYELPVLRAFSPDLKRFVYVDVDDVTEHEFDEKAKDLIVLPEDMKRVLDAVFDTTPGKVFGDLFRNRHGGIIILASGGPGVGKTLTAEVYAEYTKRPLYVMEMGELGTNLDSVEGNLQKIFNRARRWNAILLFDEADVFLGERGEDLEKAAIVGVFLRLLDRYEGCLFLTTNRPGVIDKAFKSRISLSLKYPPLTEDYKKRVWEQLLHAAGFVFEGGYEPLIALDLNGRNIRNVMRVLRILYPDAVHLTFAEIEGTLKYIEK